MPEVKTVFARYPEDSSGGRVDEKLGEKRWRILKLMLNDPTISIVKLAQLLDISETAVDKNLDYLKKQGDIKRFGPAKGGYWEIIKQEK